MPPNQQNSPKRSVFDILGIPRNSTSQALGEAIRAYKRSPEVRNAHTKAQRLSAGGEPLSAEENFTLDEFGRVTDLENRVFKSGVIPDQALNEYRWSLGSVDEGAVSGTGGSTEGFAGVDLINGKPFNIYGTQGAGPRPDLTNPDEVFKKWGDEAKKRIKVPYHELGLAKAIFQARKNPGSVVTVGKTTIMGRHIKAPSELRYGLQGPVYQVSVDQTGELSVQVNPNHFLKKPTRDANELVALNDFLQTPEKEGLLWTNELITGLDLYVKIVDRDSREDGLHLPIEAVNFLKTLGVKNGIPFGPPIVTFDNRKDFDQELNAEGSEAIVRLEYQPPVEGKEGVSSIA